MLMLNKAPTTTAYLPADFLTEVCAYKTLSVDQLKIMILIMFFFGGGDSIDNEPCESFDLMLNNFIKNYQFKNRTYKNILKTISLMQHLGYVESLQAPHYDTENRLCCRIQLNITKFPIAKLNLANNGIEVDKTLIVSILRTRSVIRLKYILLYLVYGNLPINIYNLNTLSEMLGCSDSSIRDAMYSIRHYLKNIPD
jgi:hypothetical protein